MLYPALVMKVVSFLDKEGKSHNKPIKDSNLVKVQLDTGEVKVIEYVSNNKDMNSLYDYLYDKALKAVKKDKVKSGMTDLMFSSDPKVIEAIAKEELNYPNDPKAKNKAVESLVKKSILNKSLIKAGSIIRSAFADSYNNNIPKIKAIYVTQDMNTGKYKYSGTGIYFHAATYNQIPIELINIRNKEGQAIGYTKLVTSNLINKEQINYLIDHSIRTLRQKSFIPGFNSYGVKDQHLKSIYMELESIRKNKDNVDINRAILLLEQLKEYLNNNPAAFKEFKMELPILLPLEDFSKGLLTVSEDSGKSPFQMFKEAFINLNYSKENPDIKKALKDFVLKSFIMRVINGSLDMRLLTTYNIPKGDLFGNSDSWGYMHNNIDYSKVTISKKDIDLIKIETDKFLSQLKGV